MSCFRPTSPEPSSLPCEPARPARPASRGLDFLGNFHLSATTAIKQHYPNKTICILLLNFEKPRLHTPGCSQAWARTTKSWTRLGKEKQGSGWLHVTPLQRLGETGSGTWTHGALKDFTTAGVATSVTCAMPGRNPERNSYLLSNGSFST